jgi:hypothetical protein
MLNAAMPEIELPRIDAVVGELVSTGGAEHVAVFVF